MKRRRETDEGATETFRVDMEHNLYLAVSLSYVKTEKTKRDKFRGGDIFDIFRERRETKNNQIDIG